MAKINAQVSATRSNGSTAPANTSVVELVKDKDCKGSVRFITDDFKAAISNAYVNRSMPGINDATKIRVTIEVIA